MEKILSYFLPILIVYVMKLKLLMRIKIFMLTKINLILATTQKTAHFSTKQTRK